MNKYFVRFRDPNHTVTITAEKVGWHSEAKVVHFEGGDGRYVAIFPLDSIVGVWKIDSGKEEHEQ